MIDYYKAMDLETGQEVPHLKEVSFILQPQMSATDCFTALSILREELDGRWTNGTLDENGRLLQADLPKLRKIFVSDHEKGQYDRALKRAWKQYLDAKQPVLAPGDASSSDDVSSGREKGLEEAAQAIAKVEANKGLSAKNIILAGLAFLVLLILILLFNVNVIVLIIGAILIVALMLLMS